MNVANAGFFSVSVDKLESLAGYQQTRWAYRGQKDDTWHLMTSLERFLNRNKGETGLVKRLEVEQRLLREFRRRYHHYSSSVPATSLDLEWLALMRHYGAPTRLLDFTYSLYVAAYFAVEDAEDDDVEHTEGKSCCVWGINIKWCEDTACELINRKGCNGYWVKLLVNEDTEHEFRNIFMRTHPIDMVAPLNPFRLSERLTTQHGVFLCPGNVNKTFEENLKALPGWNDSHNVIRITIPIKRRGEILRELWNMNINRSSLFPGLDGFAGTLGVYHPVVFRETPTMPAIP